LRGDLQYVRKIGSFSRLSKANEEACERAVDEVTRRRARRLASLVTWAPPKARQMEAARARARA